MSADYFLDTNIFVYTFDSSAPDKQRKARALVHAALQEGRGVVSTQVMQEFLNVATRKFQHPLSPADGKLYLHTVLAPLCEVIVDADLLGQALDLQASERFSFYDSLIVAAAIQAHCRILYTEDMQAGRKIGTLAIRNPFEALAKPPHAQA